MALWFSKNVCIQSRAGNVENHCPSTISFFIYQNIFKLMQSGSRVTCVSSGFKFLLKLTNLAAEASLHECNDYFSFEIEFLNGLWVHFCFFFFLSAVSTGGLFSVIPISSPQWAFKDWLKRSKNSRDGFSDPFNRHFKDEIIFPLIWRCCSQKICNSPNQS